MIKRFKAWRNRRRHLRQSRWQVFWDAIDDAMDVL